MSYPRRCMAAVLSLFLLAGCSHTEEIDGVYCSDQAFDGGRERAVAAMQLMATRDPTGWSVEPTVLEVGGFRIAFAESELQVGLQQNQLQAHIQPANATGLRVEIRTTTGTVEVPSATLQRWPADDFGILKLTLTVHSGDKDPAFGDRLERLAMSELEKMDRDTCNLDAIFLTEPAGLHRKAKEAISAKSSV